MGGRQDRTTPANSTVTTAKRGVSISNQIFAVPVAADSAENLARPL